MIIFNMYVRREFSNIKIYLCLLCLVSSYADSKTKCPGPLKFYEDVRCKPIKHNPSDFCAFKYDCTHLYKRNTSKCYINENVYEIDEKLKPEDGFVCDGDCICEKGDKGVALFNCESIDCPFEEILSDGCFLQHSSEQCCPGELVCPENPVHCIVDGNVFKGGEFFELKNQPNTICQCKEGYKGENVQPFCYTPKSSLCRTELKMSYEINKKCAPVYVHGQSPQTACSFYYKCQNKKYTYASDFEDSKMSNQDKSNFCTFGDTLLKIGDEFQESDCIRCKCEVPPILTCQKLPEYECTP